MATLVIKVVDAVTGSVLPWVYVDVEGRVVPTGLDGVSIFEVLVCKSVSVKIRHAAYRPWSYSFHAREERRYELEVKLEKAVL